MEKARYREKRAILPTSLTNPLKFPFFAAVVEKAIKNKLSLEKQLEKLWIGFSLILMHIQHYTFVSIKNLELAFLSPRQGGLFCFLFTFCVSYRALFINDRSHSEETDIGKVCLIINFSVETVSGLKLSCCALFVLIRTHDGSWMWIVGLTKAQIDYLYGLEPTKSSITCLSVKGVDDGIKIN